MQTDSNIRQYRIHDYETIPLSQIEKPDLENLRHIANRTIKMLCSDGHANLLVFPDKLNKYGDNIGECTICSMDIDNEQLRTGDIMGFIGRNHSLLTIASRFAANDNEDYFLHYMIQKVLGINLFKLKHTSSRNRIFDFLVSLFPFYLKRALNQGLYKQYIINAYNDTNVRGIINISKHIRSNTPFIGRIAYNIKESSYDNDLSQLIRHTIESIRNSYMSSILKTDADTEACILQICRITSSYKALDRSRIIAKNRVPLAHPYYVAYQGLQKLCIQILTHQGLKYGNNQDEIYGLLISGSWLWEEFLYKTVLHDCGFLHPQNKIGKNSIYLFEKKTNKEDPCFKQYKRYPDYIKDGFILDAKYKDLDDNIIDRNDMHQIITYMYVEQASAGGFIYPQKESSNTTIIFNTLGKLRGYGGHICNIGIPIPDHAGSYGEFVEKMNWIQEKLKEKIRAYTDNELE